jgi:hypothetical protein
MRRYETILKVQGGNEVLSGLASEGMERIWLQSPGSTGRISQAYQEEKTSILAHLKETEEKEGAVIEGLPAAGSQEEDRLAHVAMGIGHPSKKAVNFVIEESILEGHARVLSRGHAIPNGSVLISDAAAPDNLGAVVAEVSKFLNIEHQHIMAFTNIVAVQPRERNFKESSEMLGLLLSGKESELMAKLMDPDADLAALAFHHLDGALNLLERRARVPGLSVDKKREARKALENIMNWMVERFSSGGEAEHGEYEQNVIPRMANIAVALMVPLERRYVDGVLESLPENFRANASNSPLKFSDENLKIPAIFIDKPKAAEIFDQWVFPDMVNRWQKVRSTTFA